MLIIFLVMDGLQRTDMLFCPIISPWKKSHVELKLHRKQACSKHPSLKQLPLSATLRFPGIKPMSLVLLVQSSSTWATGTFANLSLLFSIFDVLCCSHQLWKTNTLEIRPLCAASSRVVTESWLTNPEVHSYSLGGCLLCFSCFMCPSVSKDEYATRSVFCVRSPAAWW